MPGGSQGFRRRLAWRWAAGRGRFHSFAARLAADVAGVPTVLIARTDAESAKLLTSDVDDRDKPFCTGERSAEGYYYVKQGIETWIHGWKRNGWRTAAKAPVKNADLWQALDELNASHNVEWRWVKGHSGDPGNERADQLSNDGIPK